MSQNVFAVYGRETGKVIVKPFEPSHTKSLPPNVDFFALTNGTERARNLQLDLVNQWNRTSATFGMQFTYFLP